MKTFVGTVYFKDGHHSEVSVCHGGESARQSCESATARIFDQYMRNAIAPMFEPSRYDVRERV